MIKEFSVHAKPRNNNAKIFFLIGISISALVFILSLMIESYKGVVGFAALLMITTSILIYTKYVAVDFYYDITFDYNEAPVFVVRQVTGKRATTLCRIEIADIDSVQYVTKKDKSKELKEKGVKRYIYTPTLFPPDCFRIFASNRYEKYELVIECSSEFAELLVQYSKEAKENRILEDNEE